MPGGQVRSQSKDMENVLRAATDSGLTLPVSELVRSIYRSIVESIPAADQAAALLALEARNPGKRLGLAEDQLPSGSRI